MQTGLATGVAFVVALVLGWSPTTAEARSASTQRIIGNRTGSVLTKSKADTWCALRGFTAHKT